MEKNILLTGKPGIGKTTLIKKVVNGINKKLKISGFYTEEIREDNERVGFRIITIDGKEGILSHINIRSNLGVGKYFVNLKDIDEIAVKSISENSDLIVIDEIGKMELLSEKFRNAVLVALDTRKVFGTIRFTEDEFIDRIKNRADTEILDVNLGNRELLAPELIRRINQ